MRCGRALPGAVALAAMVAGGGCRSHTIAEDYPARTVIKIDHFGYRPADAKVAVFTVDPGQRVYIRDLAGRDAFEIPRRSDTIVSMGRDALFSGDHVWWVDFSAFERPGTYYFDVPNLAGPSYAFDISNTVYEPALRAALKTFFYQRCGTHKPAPYAGRWADAGICHLSDRSLRPAPGEPDFGVRDLSGGWHDAGDYNKGVAQATTVAEAIHFLLRAYEDVPAVFGDDVGLPESRNSVPDVLDEIKWELDWLLKMQLADGAVLSMVRADRFATSAPPSRDGAVRHYHGPTLESAAVLAGLAAEASTLFNQVGQTAFAARLQQAALAAWKWIERRDEHAPIAAWAAAEVLRAIPSAAGARRYVERFHPDGWANAELRADIWDTQAAFTYSRSTTADPAIAASMRTAIDRHVDAIFADNDLYRNGIPYTEYHWGSNRVRAKRGLSLMMAARLGASGSHTVQDLQDHALDFLHYFHGQNPLGMMFLTNMAALGGEHSSFRFYHAWFGDSRDPFSRRAFIGKPRDVEEPEYPYFSGADNLGVRDDGTSEFGPPRGFLVGGPNKNYSGASVPPGNEIYFGRFYRDWSDLDEQASSRAWEITENSISAQGPYVALVAYAAGPRPAARGPRTLVHPPLQPAAPARVVPFNRADRIQENGTWSAPRAALRLASRQSKVPARAVTEGEAAIAVCASDGSQWKNEFATLKGFEPRRWSNYARLTLDLYVDRPVIGGSVHQLLLYGDSAAAGLYGVRLSTRAVPLVKGPNAVSFPLDFPDGIEPGDELSALKLSLFVDEPGSGCIYVDALRFEQDASGH